MELLVDIGNSRIKWCDRDRLLSADISSTPNSNLQDMLDREWSRMHSVESIWVSSVASVELNGRLTAWIEHHWNDTPHFARTYPQQLGVVNGYDNPAHLGVDRWLALIGARHLFNRALIVVDCGTATTIDAMDQDGRHMGGLILPGLRLMRDSLMGNTAMQASESGSMLRLFAQDTKSGIDSARILSTTCLIERVAASLRERVGGAVHCVLTGGNAEEIKESLNMNVYHEPNLVLQGLALVARTNDP